MCFTFFPLNYRQMQRFHSFYTFLTFFVCCMCYMCQRVRNVWKCCICFCESMNGLWFENFRANFWNSHSWKTIQKNPVSNDVVCWKLKFVLYLFLGNIGIITQKTSSACCIRWLSKTLRILKQTLIIFAIFKNEEQKEILLVAHI